MKTTSQSSYTSEVLGSRGTYITSQMPSSKLYVNTTRVKGANDNKVNTMKISDFIQIAIGAIVAIAIGAGSYVFSGMRDDISLLRADIKTGVSTLGDFKVEVVRTLGDIKTEAAKTNTKLDDLISLGKRK